jgi:hypothetical protein
VRQQDRVWLLRLESRRSKLETKMNTPSSDAAEVPSSVDQADAVHASSNGAAQNGVAATSSPSSNGSAADGADSPSGESQNGQIKANLPQSPPTEYEKVENQEWLESLDYVLSHGGHERVQELLRLLEVHAHRLGVRIPFAATTPYINTIHHSQQPDYPGDLDMERRIRSLVRYNAMAMVVRANKKDDPGGGGVGGHLATFASAASLYDVAFNHFFRARTEDSSGDQIFFQGHASPGMYARAFLEGRLDEENCSTSAASCSLSRAKFVSAPVADAGFLAVPHGLDGLGADSVDLPGAVQPLPAEPGLEEHRQARASILSSATASATSRKRWAPSRWRGARSWTTCAGYQLQPAAAGRPGARQRQDHPGAGGLVPRRGLERDQGRVGIGLGPAS